MRVAVGENDVQWEEHPDRTSADLIAPGLTPAFAGLSLGVAVYHAEEYGELQRHGDQEAVYCVSGRGTIRIGDEEFDIYPGRSFYVGRGVPHATRRTGPENVKVVYVHAPA
ncbi:MAG: cupin domain-containing protein [Anaerolineae bacterium]